MFFWVHGGSLLLWIPVIVFGNTLHESCRLKALLEKWCLRNKKEENKGEENQKEEEQ